VRSHRENAGLTHLIEFFMRASGDPDLKVYGIFGFPLGHTASPAIQNRAFEACGLKSFYFAFERKPGRFRFLMRNLRSLLLDGFNVTVPFKETVIPYLDVLSPDARAIGAVNTVVKKGRRWIGRNTEWVGFLAVRLGRPPTRSQKAACGRSQLSIERPGRRSI
jgi:shikimate 5-dehydrogenase